jgi:hypothetical protein
VVSGEGYVSRGHPPGDARATVRITPAARDAYRDLTPGTEVPVGTLVAQLQEPGPVFVMHKIAPDQWQFLELAADGRPAAEDRSALCQRCHAEAVSDQLFGLPPQTTRPDGGAAGSASSERE